MYRKVIPEVLRLKILKKFLKHFHLHRPWRLKFRAQLLLNDAVAGQWNATRGDGAGAELRSPGPARVTAPAVSGAAEPGPRPRQAQPGLSCTAPSPWALHKTRNYTESAGKCLFLDTLFSVLPVFWLSTCCSGLQSNYENMWNAQNFDLNLVGKKGK